MKALIADDDLFYREMICSWLKDIGFEVVLARNGQEALGICDLESLDIVILDVFMDIVNGIEVLNRLTVLADMQAAERIPVIVITSDDSAHTEKIVRQQKSTFYLLKPFEKDFFINVINEAMRADIRSLG